MSEWKFCGNCDHHYEMHRGWDSGKPGFGPCEAPGCECEMFYAVDTP